MDALDFELGGPRPSTAAPTLLLPEAMLSQLLMELGGTTSPIAGDIGAAGFAGSAEPWQPGASHMLHHEVARALRGATPGDIGSGALQAILLQVKNDQRITQAAEERAVAFSHPCSVCPESFPEAGCAVLHLLLHRK